jgi:hypothetical protein
MPKITERNSVKIILKTNKFIEFQYYLPAKDLINKLNVFKRSQIENRI